MKRISRRMIFLIVLMAVLALGLLVFALQFALHGGDWVTFSGSPHVYAGANLSTGRVTDRSGILLLDSTDGRAYSEDAALRKATMHLLGDRYGYISAPVLNSYADHMVGYSPINGLYTAAPGGNTARLTISAPVQKLAQELLAGRKGTIGVYNYKTGEILCAVTAPTYDPDDMPDVENDPAGVYDGVYLNRFFQTTYVPGSIYKIVTALAALETIPDIQTRTFQCEGKWDCEGDVINCNGYHGAVTLQQALGASCNVAFGQLAVELGPELLTAYAEKLGITKSLTFDGVSTAAGTFDVADAANSQIAWSGIGQHTDLINACQYLTVLGAIANGGSAAVPHVMESVSGGLMAGYTAETQTVDLGLDEGKTAVLADMMHQAVVNHYGAWQFPAGKICAKSGTAELGEGTTPHATFAGFLQEEAYPLAFVVIIEHGGSGSAACAPVAGQVLNACVEMLKKEG